jgi:hypothetical protein
VPHFEQEQAEGTVKCFISLNLSSQMSSTGISLTPLTEQQSQSLSWCSVTKRFQAEIKDLKAQILIEKLFVGVNLHGSNLVPDLHEPAH